MTSQKRKTRMPVASDESAARALRLRRCTRPTGRPRKIVAPAIPPRRKICAVDTSDSLTVLVRVPLHEGARAI